jgi:DNA end-binding protein Ku
MIIRETGNRIKMVTKDSETGRELERRSLLKGYEFSKGRYVLLSDEDLDSAKVKSSAVMAVEKFIEAGSIDPIYFDVAITWRQMRKPARMSMPCFGRRSPRPALSR